MSLRATPRCPAAAPSGFLCLSARRTPPPGHPIGNRPSQAGTNRRAGPQGTYRLPPPSVRGARFRISRQYPSPPPAKARPISVRGVPGASKPGGDLFLVAVLSQPHSVDPDRSRQRPGGGLASPAVLGRLRGVRSRAGSPARGPDGLAQPSARERRGAGRRRIKAVGGGGAQSVSAAGEDARAVAALDMACRSQSPPRYRNRSDRDAR